MIRFWRNLALIALPFALPFLIFTSILIYSGESMPLTSVIRAQMEDERILYRPRYGNRDFPYKLLGTIMRQPDILALGSSHVLQMRADFFDRDPSQFYNAGAPAWGLGDVERFLTALPADALPQTLILGLDHPWFNDAYDYALDEPDTTDFAHLFAVNQSFMRSLLGNDTMPFEQITERREPRSGATALGLRAIRDGHGFRGDGSEQYGDFLVARWLDPAGERQHHLDMLRDGVEMYLRGDTVSTNRLAQLGALLDFCEARGIYVIGFLPPFSPSQWDAIIAGGHHEYIEALPESLQPLFDDRGFALFDFSDGAWLNATDGDFFDGWHGSERVFLRLYLEILGALPERLSIYSDATTLQALEAAASDTFFVFD